MILKPLFLVVLLTAAFSAMAQHAPDGDTVLKGATIEVIQSYKPQVKQVPKPQWVPQLPPADTAHPSFRYEVPQQTLYYTYSSLPLRPLALGIDSPRVPYSNYAKAGGGNLSTIFLDAGIGGIAGKTSETAIHLHHISQSGDIKYQQTAMSGIEAEGILHSRSTDWHATLIGERNQYYYYGYPDNQSKDSLKQTYTLVRAMLDFKPKDSSGKKVSYHPAFPVSIYHAKYSTTEATAGIYIPVVYQVDSILQAQVTLAGAYTHLSVPATNSSNNYLELLPGFTVHKGLLSGHALLGLALGKGGSGYVLPDVLAQSPIVNTKLLVSGGWQATLRRNTYEELTTENPYLIYGGSPAYNTQQTRRDEVFANLQGSLGDHFTYSGRLSWWAYNDLPTFLNNVGNEKQFYIDYEDVRAVAVRAEIRYKVANTWSAGLSGDFYDFYHHSDEHVWHEPGTKIKGDFMILPLPKLTVTAYLAVLGDIYARDISGNVVKLKTIADLGGNAEYQFIPRLSAFVQLSNLLDDKYQRWLGYQAYGLNVYAGVRLKF